MTIDWNRARSIFGHPKPPRQIWEKQFDNFDEELQKLAQTPYEEIDFHDLWYYHHDLAYVELQPEVFAYLFPVCLMDWRASLMKNESCSHGDSEFHYGLVQGNVLDKMLTPLQRELVADFFHDSLFERIDAERGLRMKGSNASAHGWMYRMNSLGMVSPIIPEIWATWWSLDTVGKATAAIQYLSGLMYFEGENPVFDMWTPHSGGGGPYLWENDSHFIHTGWRAENSTFLGEVLNYRFVETNLPIAVEMLNEQPDCDIAKQVLADLPERTEIVELRTRELPELLRDPNSDGWSV